MSEHFNQLTPAEDERLTILFEECSEVIKEAGKIHRHGYNDYSPFDESKTFNRRKLETELGHLLNAIEMMIQAGDVERQLIDISCDEKAASIGRWLHHQEPSK